MSKEYKGLSYMLIVKDQTSGYWSLLKKFLLLKTNDELTGSYISSSWYQQEVKNLEEPIEYYLICINATTAISDIINELINRINNTNYQFTTLIGEFNYLFDIWHFTIPPLSKTDINKNEEIEIVPKNRTDVVLKFSLRKYCDNNTTAVLVSTPSFNIDLSS